MGGAASGVRAKDCLTIKWSNRANQDFRRQAKWLAAHRDEPAVTHYFEEVTAALDKLGKSSCVEYQLVDEAANIRKVRVGKQTDLYYRLAGDDLLLLTFFDTRQDPGKLKL